MKCKHIKKEGASCSLNSKCTYPNCSESSRQILQKLKDIVNGTALLVFFALLSGCSSKKSVSEKVYIERNDSINNTIRLNTNNELIISNLCDSITGKAKEFENVVDFGTGSTKASVKDNRLVLESKTDSIVYRDVIRTEKVYVDRNEETIRYRTDWRIIIILGLVILAMFIFPVIPRFVNMGARKLLNF